MGCRGCTVSRDGGCELCVSCLPGPGPVEVGWKWRVLLRAYCSGTVASWLGLSCENCGEADRQAARKSTYQLR